MFDLAPDRVEESRQDHSLPEGLADTAPGAGLGSVLASIDRDHLSAEDQVIVMQAWSRQVAHAQAELYRSMVAVAQAEGQVLGSDPDAEVWNDLAASEIRAALAWTRRAADSQLELAIELADRHQQVWGALHRGEIDLPKARVILQQTIHLDREPASRVAKVTLQTATRETTGQLRSRIQRLVIEIDPDSALARYQEAVTGRRVIQEATSSGTANLMGLDLPAEDANAAMDRLDHMAHRLKATGDRRPIDQIRADLFLDLLNGRLADGPEPGRGVVDIRVDLTTLAGLDDKPGNIPGWGPVIADIARKVVKEQESSEWRATVTDKDGNVAHVFTTRRRPTRAQRRRAQAQAMTCVFPGCRRPARKSDIDHRVDWAKGGQTEDENLEPVCRHDHVLKHSAWNLEKLETGEYLWTSPLGLKYTVDPRAP